MDKYTEEVKAEIKGLNKVFSLGDLRLYECPLTYIAAETREILRLVFLMNDTKHLLFEGGWADQPYWLIEAIEIYRAESARHMKDQRGKGSNGK